MDFDMVEKQFKLLDQMQKAQEKLKEPKISGASENGFVTAWANGMMQVCKFEFSPEVLKYTDTALLAEDTKQAVENLMKNVQTENLKKSMQMAGMEGVDPELLMSLQKK